MTPRQETAFTCYRLALEALLTIKAAPVYTAAEGRERFGRIEEARRKLDAALDELDGSIVDEISEDAWLVYQTIERRYL